ncbi:hypothetical protein BH23ACT5_BH23ACT5_00970 [soil metagenome]
MTEPSELAWLTTPPSAAWAEATALLEKLGALRDGSVTDAGRAMASLPLHPRLARMIVDAGPDAGLAVWLATLIDERDPLRGHPDELPVDVAVRLRLLTDPSYQHPAMAVGALRRLRDVAADLARRAGVGDLADMAIDRAGCVLALAFPDRLAIRRGSPGRFQLRTGTTAVIGPADTLAAERFVVVADLDGRRKDARIRLAAGVSEKDVIERFSRDIEHARRLTWVDGRLVDRTEIRLGGIVLQTVDRRPQPSEETTAALVKRVVDEGTQVLPWTGDSLELRSRVSHLRAALGAQWPDWSDSELRSSAARWLGPHLVAAAGWDDVQRLDLASLLRGSLDHRLFEQLGSLAPTHIVVPSGRRIRVDYSGELPRAAIRVQEMFGSTETPTVGGRPVVLELLSPANRPVQVTSDLTGFWEGSWAEVRKEMAGRYPKHHWPVDPAQARPR